MNLYACYVFVYNGVKREGVSDCGERRGIYNGKFTKGEK